MNKINGTLTFVDKNGDDKSLVRAIQDATEVKIGSAPFNDITIQAENVEDLHCKIYFNGINRVWKKNLSIIFALSPDSQFSIMAPYSRHSFENCNFNSFFPPI